MGSTEAALSQLLRHPCIWQKDTVISSPCKLYIKNLFAKHSFILAFLDSKNVSYLSWMTGYIAEELFSVLSIDFSIFINVAKIYVAV